jgi:hypothetical protein
MVGDMLIPWLSPTASGSYEVGADTPTIDGLAGPGTVHPR